MTIARYQPKKQYELLSQRTHRLCLTGVKDIAPTLTPNGEEKPRVRFIWEAVDERDSQGVAKKAFQTFHLTLHPQSFLAKTIVDITGKSPGYEFDLDTLIGAEVDALIKHNQSDDGRVYANIAAILRPMTKEEAAEEQRVKSATELVLAASHRPHTVTSERSESEITDSDIPF